MKLQRLQLTNFRGFEHLDLPFHDRLTVLVGVNGSGKSSVLEGLRIMLVGTLHQAVRASYPTRQEPLNVTDIRDGGVEADAKVSIRAEGKTWNYEEDWLRDKQHHLVELRGTWTVDFAEQDPVDHAEWLSLIYSTRRALLEEDGGEQSGNPLTLRAAYQESLTGRGAYASFIRWFRAREDVENEQRLRGDPTLRDSQLQAVRRAITSMMPGYDDLFVQRHPRETLVLSKQGKKLGVHQLSDGEKRMLAMVGDIARRMAMVAAEGKDPLDIEALVMIDEVELHLHPRWQREVVPALLRTFPRTQFVLTTHSPQVLGSVAQESIVVLDDFKAYPAGSPTKGRDSNSILVDLMGLPEHPRETAERLHRIALLIDDDQYEQARQAIEELARELGEEDREVIRLQSLLGFLEG